MPVSDRARELVIAAAEAASDKLADDIIAFDVSEQLAITDAFILCSAPNDRQVKAIVNDAITAPHLRINVASVPFGLQRGVAPAWKQALGSPSLIRAGMELIAAIALRSHFDSRYGRHDCDDVAQVAVVGDWLLVDGRDHVAAPHAALVCRTARIDVVDERAAHLIEVRGKKR